MPVADTSFRGSQLFMSSLLEGHHQLSSAPATIAGA
jgi:hypothetical protein